MFIILYLGRLFSYRLSSTVRFFSRTKMAPLRVSSRIPERYISNYWLTHAFTRASHYLAVANARFSYNLLNFNND